MEAIATTTSGKVRGRLDAGTAVFLGIPYAAPPFGEGRLAAPTAPVAWDGVRDALDYGPTAPQPHRQFTLVPEPVMDGEDCLNLNVFTPDLGAGSRLPVLVWIHGGGFTAGCNASPWYRGHRFARDGIVFKHPHPDLSNPRGGGSAEFRYNNAHGVKNKGHPYTVNLMDGNTACPPYDPSIMN